MKFQRSKLFVLVFVFLCLGGMLFAGIWDYREDYQKATIITTLREGEVKFPGKKKTDLRIFYSLVGNLHSVWEGGKVALHLHVQIKEKVHRGRVRVLISMDGNEPAKYEMLKPNFPISLPEGLDYSFPFSYSLGDEIQVRVVSPEKAFPEFTLKFTYPRSRF